MSKCFFVHQVPLFTQEKGDGYNEAYWDNQGKPLTKEKMCKDIRDGLPNVVNYESEEKEVE